MSAPITIRSNSASKGSLYDLLQLPPSPPTFVTERHACAFPSWPNRPSLSCPPTSNPSSNEGSEFFTELDVLGQRQQQARQTRLRRPSNYLELEFEDDSDDEDSSSDQSSTESTPCGSQTDNHGLVKPNPSVPNTRSALSNQLRKYKHANDLRRKIHFGLKSFKDEKDFLKICTKRQDRTETARCLTMPAGVAHETRFTTTRNRNQRRFAYGLESSYPPSVEIVQPDPPWWMKPEPARHSERGHLTLQA